MAVTLPGRYNLLHPPLLPMALLHVSAPYLPAFKHTVCIRRLAMTTLCVLLLEAVYILEGARGLLCLTANGENGFVYLELSPTTIDHVCSLCLSSPLLGCFVQWQYSVRTPIHGTYNSTGPSCKYLTTNTQYYLNKHIAFLI